MDERILIVEDDQDTRYLFAQILRSSGYVPFAVATGEEALQRGVAESPDLVLLDLGLPGIDGWETLRQLRERPATARIPVVIVSARDGLENLLRAYSSGVSYYAVKPCRKHELLRGIRMALGERGAAGGEPAGQDGVRESGSELRPSASEAGPSSAASTRAQPRESAGTLLGARARRRPGDDEGRSAADRPSGSARRGT